MIIVQPCVQRWQSQQHSWSMEGLTSRRAPRTPATTNSTVSTHSFHKGHLAFLPINLFQKPNGVIYPLIFYQSAGLNVCIEEYRRDSFSKMNYRFTSVDHLTLSRSALEKVRLLFAADMKYEQHPKAFCLHHIGTILNLNPFR